MTETNTFTPDQRHNMKERALHDAKLLEGGADYNERGVLTPTASQKEHLAQTFTREKKEQFRNETLEGQQIALHSGVLGEVDAILSSGLGNAVLRSPMELAPIEDYAPWMKANGIQLDVEALAHVSPHDSAEAADAYKAAQDKVRGSIHELQLLGDKLIQYPQFGIGHEVSVLRNGNGETPPYMQAGWKVESVLGSGRLNVVATTEQGTISKAVSADQLLAWSQPRNR